MSDEEIQVYKKIIWGLSEMTKEKVEAYKFEQKLESPSTKIVIGDNITEWSLRLYPGGYHEANKDSVGFYLGLKGADSRTFKTKFTLGIVGKKGNKEVQYEWPGESFENGYDYGCKDLMKRSDFLNPALGYLVDGKLTMYCKLTITSKKATEGDKEALLNQNHLGHFKKMMDDEIFTDFEIETTEKNGEKNVLKAHKNVLAYGSPFFFGMLTTAMKETKENVVKVPEDSVVMKEVLRFIYSREVENLSAIANELIFAAEKYQLAGLKEMCIDSIIKSLEPKNVLQTLLAADSLTKSEKLKDNNFQFVSDSEEWKKLSPSLFLEITRRTIAEDKGTVYV